jgi:Tfp pilus assembly protein PilO
MAITNFTTPLGAAPIPAKSNTLLYLAIGAVVVYLGYKYIIKPEMDKKKAEENKQ